MNEVRFYPRGKKTSCWFDNNQTCSFGTEMSFHSLSNQNKFNINIKTFYCKSTLPYFIPGIWPTHFHVGGTFAKTRGYNSPNFFRKISFELMTSSLWSLIHNF